MRQNRSMIQVLMISLPNKNKILLKNQTWFKNIITVPNLLILDDARTKLNLRTFVNFCLSLGNIQNKITSIMETIVSRKQQESDPFQMCEVGIITSDNYKVIEFSAPKKEIENTKDRKDKKQRPFQIIQVCCFGRIICLLDENRDVWVILRNQDCQNQIINLSQLIRKRANEVYVGEDEIIINCDKNDYMICFRQSMTKPPPSFVLQKILSRNNTVFENQFSVYELQEQFGKYFLSFDEKTQKSRLNMAFKQKTIKNLQTKQQFLCQNNVVGVSYSKYHNICWDLNGAVYSWGLRSSWIIQTNQLIMRPTKVESLKDEFVFCAAADQYHSVIINREGELIEWGIKNKIQIYPHQRIKGKSGFQRMISIKACDRMYASLGISGKLYLWGENSQNFLIGIPGNKQYPTPCRKVYYKKLSDFDFTSQYIVVVGSGQSQFLRRFKLLQTNGIKSDYKKLIKSKRLLTSSGSNFSLPIRERKPRMKTQVEFQNAIKDFQDQNQDQQTITYISSRPSTIQKKFSSSSIHFNKMIQHSKSSLMLLKSRGNLIFEKINLKLTDIKKSARNTKYEINNFIKTNPIKDKHLKFSRSKQNNFNSTCETMRKTIPYQSRLKMATQRKAIIDTLRLNTLTEKMFENKKVKKQLIVKNKRRKMMEMVVKVMMRDWICRVLTKPIIGAKLLMVDKYRNSLAFQLKVRRLQSTFLKKYISQKMQKLSPYCKYLIQRFLKKTRLRLRKRRQKKLAADLITYSNILNIKKQIYQMILLYTFTIKKYQKIARWCKQVNSKRLLAMRIKWNLSFINENFAQFKEQSLFSEFKNQQSNELQVADIYQNFVKIKPELRLNHFTEIHPIFRVNFNITKKMNYRQIVEHKPERLNKFKKVGIVARIMKKSKVSKIYLGKKTESEDSQFQRLKIMPYSSQYDKLIFSRKFSLKIPENVLKTTRWGQFQCSLLQSLLEHHIKQIKKKYIQQLEQYSQKIANFIENNFQQINSRRAKYLLIPAIMSLNTCKKLKRELDRIIKKSQKNYLIQSHLLQDRHIILDITYGLQNCPTKPKLAYTLDKEVFRQLFLVYVGRLSKAARLLNVKNYAKLDELLKFE